MDIENPPAFPLAVTADTTDYHGMSLRDWFAGQALAGILANKYAFGSHFQGDPEHIATTAGTFADAMLAARAQVQS